MSQPAAVKLKIAKVRGKAIPPGSSFAKVDWDRADEYLTGSHNPDDQDLGIASQIAREEVERYKEEGRESKVRKAQAAINAYDNARFAIRASWCPTCINFLHNCQCQVEEELKGAPVELVDRLTARLSLTHSQLRKAKRQAKQGG